VAAFLAGRIGFVEIVDTVARVLGEHDGAAAGSVTLDEVLAAETWARARAREALARVNNPPGQYS